MYGIIKRYKGATQTTIAKLQKLIYVYDVKTKTLIIVLPTVECLKLFKKGKDTLYKYLNTNITYKGRIFSHVLLD